MLVQNQGQESPTESASSRDTSPTADGIVANNRENESNGNDYSRDTSPTADGFVMKKRENGRNGNDCFEQAGSRATSSTANGIVAKKRDNERNGNDYSRYTSPTADGFVMKKRENGRNDNDCSEQAGSRDTSPAANGIVRKKRENGRNDNDCSEQAGSRDTSPTANGIVGKKRENERNGNDYSRDRSPTANGFVMTKRENERNDNDCFEQSVVRRGIFTGDKITLRTIAEERVDVISEKMQVLPDEYLEELKNGLRVVLEGNGGSQQREEFLGLQKLVQSRSDLTPKMLRRAHRVQLEVLVAMKMGIQAFLHPNVCLSQTSLIEIFGYKRCRNIACQNQLPVDDCTCDVCTNKSGFCNVCMCVICTKFDFEVNTCRWIGCDLCSHWTHTDCAIRDGLICMGTSARVGTGQAEMLFRCRACNRTSELLGWVKDVFQHCAPSWSRTALMTELDIVERIFRGSEDVKGRKLFWKCEELVEKMKSGLPESAACRAILMFFQELDADPSRNAGIGEGGRLLAPQEACKQIAEVVQEAIRKMEMVAEEKLRMLKKARLNLETCDRELEDKAREAAELKLERQRRKQQIDELESIVKLKQAEADMFQLKADETRREAEMLQKIALAKSEKSEEDYRTRYLKLKLSEAEAEKQYLFQKMKSQDSSRATHGNDVNDSSHMFSNALKNVYNVSSSADCQTSERNSGRKNS